MKRFWKEDWRFDTGQRNHEKKIKSFDFVKTCYIILFKSNRKKFTFHQDNNPKQSSKLSQNHLEAKKQRNEILEIMIWPSQSFDLLPIKLVLNEL